jgi:hypothetical protein
MNATNLVRRASAALLFVLFSSSLLAQTLTVPTAAAAGTSMRIGYSNPAMAGKTVVATVTGGTPASTHDVILQVDSNGNASATFTIPANWNSAYVNAPGCEQQIVNIQ